MSLCAFYGGYRGKLPRLIISNHPYQLRRGLFHSYSGYRSVSHPRLPVACHHITYWRPDETVVVGDLHS
jgi:hypothetical protein